MLKLDGEDFTCGRSRFADRLPEGEEPTAKIYVKIIPGNLEFPVLAQLDTGAPWSVLAPEIADAVGVLNKAGEPLTLQTRLGRLEGRLVKVSLTIVADEGDSLNMESSVFVSQQWPNGKNFLGYSNLLDSIRFALDPQANHFYFGPYTTLP